MRVECYAGTRGEEHPRWIWRGGQRRGLVVLEQVLVEAAGSGVRRARYRVRLDDGTRGWLEHDLTLDLWGWEPDPGRPRPRP